MSMWGRGLEPTEQDAASQLRVDELIEWAAEQITTRRLELPATLFLELHLPVAGLLHSFVLAGQPVLSPLFGIERLERLALLLADRKTLRQLIDRIQSKAVANPSD